MKLNIINLKVTGPNRRWVLDQLQKYADRFADRKFSAVEIGKQNQNSDHSISVYDTNGSLAYQKPFDSKDLMVGYILGANAHMSAQYIIKELCT